MRKIHTLIWHCTAAREGQEQTLAAIRNFHVRVNKWRDVGYHALVHLDGSVSRGRPESQTGAHVAGFNTGTLGYAYVGGLDRNGKPKDTRTPAQKATMRRLTQQAIALYGITRVGGHRDFSPDLNGDGIIQPHEWTKACPCFDAAPEYADLLMKKAA